MEHFHLSIFLRFMAICIHEACTYDRIGAHLTSVKYVQICQDKVAAERC